MDTGRIRKYLSDSGYSSYQINKYLFTQESENALRTVAKAAYRDGAKHMIAFMLRKIFGFSEKIMHPKEKPTNNPEEQPERKDFKQPCDKPEEQPKGEIPCTCEEHDIVHWYTSKIMQEAKIK